MDLHVDLSRRDEDWWPGGLGMMVLAVERGDSVGEIANLRPHLSWWD